MCMELHFFLTLHNSINFNNSDIYNYIKTIHIFYTGIKNEQNK